MYSPEEARVFLRALTGEDSHPVHFQTYFDADKKLGLTPGPDAYPEEWYSSFNDSLDYINYKQDAGCGVYVCINETDGQGREESNIVGLRCFMVDFDGVNEPAWVLTPHIINMRDETHGHAFWLIDAGDVTLDEWSVMQRRLALFYGTDTQVVDPCRVIRLPGSKHLKDPSNPREYKVVEVNVDTIPRYSVTQVREAHLLPADLDAELHKWAEARNGILDGTGFEYNEHEIERFIGFISNAARPAVLGSGTHELYRVALYGYDHGVPFENTVELLWQYYNPRCEPPWEDEEYDHFYGVVFRAYKYATSVPGCKTFKSSLRAFPPLKEPECGWDKQHEVFHGETFKPEQVTSVKPVIYGIEHEIDRGHRLSRLEAEVLATQLTSKSTHYRFAEVFDGMLYDGVNLIRNQKKFYEYQGNHWREVDDETIRAMVQRYYATFSPKASVTAGIFKILMDHVNTIKDVNPGTFISDPYRNTRDLVVFKNQVVDFGGDVPVRYSHTPDLFNLTALPHEYKPEATCPTWLWFLNDIWDGDQELITQLQMWFGYCLTSDTSLEKFAVLKGKSGGGKGTITTVLKAVIGDDNVCGPALDQLSSNSALQEMSKKSLCLIPEAQEVASGLRDGVLSRFKAITGGDPVSFHEMYVGSQSMVFPIKIVLSTNNFPRFNDPSGALAKRMLVFPFWKSYREKGDPTLKGRLLKEVEGITQWAIEGLKMLRANDGKFVEAKAGLREKNEIHDSTNPLSLFFKQMCQFQPDGLSSVGELYAAYRVWATSVGIGKPVYLGSFDQMIKDSDIPVTHEGELFKGIIIKEGINFSNVVPGTFGRAK